MKDNNKNTRTTLLAFEIDGERTRTDIAFWSCLIVSIVASNVFIQGLFLATTLFTYFLGRKQDNNYRNLRDALRSRDESGGGHAS